MKKIVQIVSIAFCFLVLIGSQNIVAQSTQGFDLEKLQVAESSLKVVLTNMVSEGKKSPQPMGKNPSKLNNSMAAPVSPSTEKNIEAEKRKSQKMKEAQSIKKNDSPNDNVKKTKSLISMNQMTSARKKSCEVLSSKATTQINQNLKKTEDRNDRGLLTPSQYKAQLRRIKVAKDKLADYQKLAGLVK